ncbi:MAG: PEGA domain-containing protein [Bryobacteraceae bacterium]|jgi:hypothetical protein
MKKGLLILAIALVTLAVAPTSASAAWGYWGGPYYGGWYAPYGGPYWGPGPYGRFYYGNPYAGEIKLDTKVKNAEVFINGAFVGTTHDAKKMHLRPGSYKIEIRELGKTRFAEQVYVVPGRTLHLHPVL